MCKLIIKKTHWKANETFGNSDIGKTCLEEKKTAAADDLISTIFICYCCSLLVACGCSL